MTVAENGGSTNAKANTYEEARKQRLEQNKKRFQDLGILNLSKSLSQLANSEKSSKQRLPKPKPKPKNAEVFKPRRSSRARNPVPSYHDDLDIDIPSLRKKSRSGSSAWTSYSARPLDEIKNASHMERIHALKAAEEFQISLQAQNPSFVKSMVRSHVYSCFWLGLPTQFCKDHLSRKDLDMTLEDESGSEYDAKYLGKRTGLSGGWRGFALDHKLDDGDAVVFELVAPEKFKVYTFRASATSPRGQKHDVDNVEGEDFASPMKHVSETQKRKRKKAKTDENAKLSNIQQPESVREGLLEHVNATKENIVVSQKDDNKGKSGKARKSEEGKLDELKDKNVKRISKPRKKPAPRLLRKKV